MLVMPKYIEKTMVAGLEPTFGSTDADFSNAISRELPKIYDATFDLGDRAKLALIAALVEWSVWRLDGLMDLTDLLEFAESLWASVIDYRYANDIQHTLGE